MIKPVVGKVRSPAYALPENDFVYGIESKLDKEGAGEGKKQVSIQTYHSQHGSYFLPLNYFSRPKLGPEQGFGSVLRAKFPSNQS